MGGTIARQSAKGTFVSYIGAAIGFITTFFVLTKWLTPDEIGLTRIILEIASLLSSIGLIGLKSSIFRFFPYFKDSDSSRRNCKDIINKGFFYYIFVIGVIGITVVSGFYILFQNTMYYFFAKNSKLFIDYYYTVIPLTFFYGIWTIFELYSFQLLKIAIPKLLSEVILRIILLGVYLLYALKFTSLSMMIYMYVGAYGISTVFSFLYLKHIVPINLKHDNKLIPERVKKEFPSYSLFYTIGALGTILSSRMDLFMISSIDKDGLFSAGVYTIAFYMVAVLEIPSRAIMSMSTPSLAQSMKDGNTDRSNELFRKVSLYQLLTSSFIFVVVWTSIDSVFKIMPNGDQYSDGKYIFLFLSMAKLVELVLNFGINAISCSKYYYWNLIYTFGATILALFINWILIPPYGVIGASLATFIVIFTSLSIQQYFINRKIHIHPFSKRLFLLVLIALCCCAIGYVLPSYENVYLNIFVRSSIITIFFAFLVYVFRIVPEAMVFVEPVLNKMKRKK